MNGPLIAHNAIQLGLNPPGAELKVGLHTPHPLNLVLHYMRASIMAVRENLGKPSAFPRDVGRVELLSLHERW
jgi:hypothetical protein